jgi:hypothetical protein
VSRSFPDSFATFPRSNGSLEKLCLHIRHVVLLSSDEIGHPRPRDVRHHEAFCLLYPPHTLPLSHAILHVRRTVLPLDVLVRKRSIWGYLQSVSISLQNCPLPLQVVSLICTHPRCLLPWTRVFLQRHIFTVSISGGDFFTCCPAMFTTPMCVPTLCARGRGCPISRHWNLQSRNSSFFGVRIRSTIRSSHGHAARSHPRLASEERKSTKQRGHYETRRKPETHREGPFAVLPETLKFEFCRPPHAMGIRGCHGMGAWSRWSRVALCWAPLGEQDRETRRVLGDGPRAVPAWRGGGGAGGFRKKPGGKEISRNRGHISLDRP